MKRKRLFSLSKQITNKRNNISADDDRHFACAVISYVIINKGTDEYVVHARLCARAPSAAFKMAEQGNDTEHEQFVEDTALLCPHGKKKTTCRRCQVSFNYINSELGHLHSYI